MKRSEINSILRDAVAFFRTHGFHLPPFAFWTPGDWKSRGEEAREIIEVGLGWDITDFGSGKHNEIGLVLFTLRNGLPENLKKGTGKLYAEKIMMVGVNQITPLHFHWVKMEDIINRGGGRLVVQLYNSTKEEGLADTDVTVQVDGLRRTIKAGAKISLAPGESISIPPLYYHQFWAEEHRVMVGEVSLVNDDKRDNRFLKPAGRFPEVQEDEPPLHLLVSDYPRYLKVG